jgi:ketosteroid isomerase-like protein
VPTGNGTESFVDAGDVAAVAAATLADPDAHAGAQYALTGAEAMTVSGAADVITAVTGQSVKHNDIDRETWIQASVSAGVPADYADMLRLLTETIASGRGARPTGDVESVTGAPPTSFADFVRRSARHWQGSRDESAQRPRSAIKPQGASPVVDNIEDFRALDPFFRIIEEGLREYVNGDHFFDLLAEDVVFDFVITVPDYPRHVVGRGSLIELYRGYGATFSLDRCYDLRVHYSEATSSAVLEYSSAGKVVGTGYPYSNRYISVVGIKDRKVAWWRDYLDPLRVFAALEGRPFEPSA